MIGASLAIGDFMILLMTAMFWSSLGIAGWILLGAGTIGGAVLAIWRLLLHWRRARKGVS